MTRCLLTNIYTNGEQESDSCTIQPEDTGMPGDITVNDDNLALKNAMKIRKTLKLVGLITI